MPTLLQGICSMSCDVSAVLYAIPRMSFTLTYSDTTQSVSASVSPWLRPSPTQDPKRVPKEQSQSCASSPSSPYIRSFLGISPRPFVASVPHPLSASGPRPCHRPCVDGLPSLRDTDPLLSDGYVRTRSSSSSPHRR